MNRWATFLSRISGIVDFTTPVAIPIRYSGVMSARDVGVYLGTPAVVAANTGPFFSTLPGASLFFGIPRVRSGNSTGFGIFQVHPGETYVHYDFGPYSSEIPSGAVAYLYADARDPLAAISSVLNSRGFLPGVYFYMSCWEGSKLADFVNPNLLFTLNITRAISIAIYNSNVAQRAVSLLFPRDSVVGITASQSASLTSLPHPSAPRNIPSNRYPAMTTSPNFRPSMHFGFTVLVPAQATIVLDIVLRFGFVGL